MITGLTKDGQKEFQIWLDENTNKNYKFDAKEVFNTFEKLDDSGYGTFELSPIYTKSRNPEHYYFTPEMCEQI